MTSIAIRSKLAAQKIRDDLKDRRGLGDAWEEVDETIRIEIEDEWFQIVYNLFKDFE